MAIGIARIYEGGGVFSYLLLPQGSQSLPSFIKRFDMMTKHLWHLVNAKEKDGLSIKDKTKIVKRYKNGNYKIPGQRSITPGNLKRKKSMLLHHKEVREFKEFYEFKGTYLQAVRAKGKEVKKGKGMFIESMQKYME